jgi:hypothetical protein
MFAIFLGSSVDEMSVKPTISEKKTLGPYFPAWQMSPPPTDTEIVNFNYASDEVFAKLAAYSMGTGESILSEPFDMKNVFGTSAPSSDDGPLSIFLQPVFDSSFYPMTATLIGHIAAVVPWVSSDFVWARPIMQRSLTHIFA